MKKIDRRMVFIKAHAMARSMKADVNYKLRFSMALKIVYRQFREERKANYKPAVKEIKAKRTTKRTSKVNRNLLLIA